MDILDKIQDMMYCELEDVSKKDKLDTKDVELIDKFVDIIKDIDDIAGTQDMGYSQMNGRSYNNGSSYMRGRSNRMPMYSRGSSYSRGGYSREDSKEVMLDHLQDVMNMAVDEKDRKAISRLMEQMEQN